MRTRQPVGLALTGQEIASSNTTLNTLLGGRQKSWMTGVGSTVRPSPRVQVSQRHDLNVFPSPSPSDEPSPQQLHTQELAFNETQYIVNQAFPQSIPRHDLPEPSPILDLGEQQVQAPTPNILQANPHAQVELPRVKQIQPYKRQKTVQTLQSTPGLSTQTHLIHQHICASGGLESLDPNVEQPRFRLLLDACQREDYFFVALHQLFCIWAVDPNTVLQLDGFHNQQGVGNAFQLVTKLIRENERLSLLHLKWFTEFPAPLNGLLARSDNYRRAVSAVSFFLDKLGTVKSAMIQECNQRGFPPLVDEMVNRLGLLSPVLQGVFFTASRRTLGIHDGDIGPQMENIFQQDREAHEKLAARYNTAYPPSEREVKERNAWLAKQYLLLRNNSPGTESISQLPNHNQVMTGSTATHFSGIGSFANSPQSTTPQIGSGGPRRFQNPQEQSPMVDLLTGSLQNVTPGHPTYQSTQRGSVGSIPSSNIPLQQLSKQRFAAQMPQSQLSVNTGAIVQPTPRSNHSLTPTNHTAPYLYPGAVIASQMHPNTFQQQRNLVSPQPITVQAQNSLQHFQPHDARQRHASGAGIEQSVPSPRRINSMPTVGPVNQGLPSGSRITNPLMGRSTLTETSRRADYAVQQNSIRGPWQAPIIPRHGESLPPHPPNPDVTALHQASLRSPYLVPIDKPLHIMHDDPAGRYYQSVYDFAVRPRTLPQNRSLTIIDFEISDEAYARVPKDKTVNVGSPAVRELRKGSLQYRMRCIQVKQSQVRLTSDFIIAETVWPSTIFMEINGSPIEVRRKLHHGRDLPVDITPFIRPVTELVNQIKISMHCPKGSRNDIDFDFAVEIVELLQHQQIMDMCQHRHIPIGQTLNSIKASLSGSFIDEDDDEISMVVGDLTINLADPFMSRIFDIPVRGGSCLHRECFDLQTFLTTRNSKPKAPRQPSMVDVWRCPLCGKDARPYRLQVDDFLVSVRKSLAERNELHTKAIMVSADGTWKPKPEVLSLPSKRSASRAGLNDDDESEDERTKNSETMTREKSREIEVIELDDD